MPRLVSAALLFLCTPLALAEVPDWLSGPPDLRMHPQRAPLYRDVFDDVAQRCGFDADAESLARKRLVGAVNHAVEDWQRQGRASYRARLPFLSIAGPDPVHCEFRLDGRRIQQALETRDGETAAQEARSDERQPHP
jgi:hypothetical protein